MKTLQKLIRSGWTRTIISLITVVLIIQSGAHLLPNSEIVSCLGSPWFFLAIALGIAYRMINAYGWALVLRTTGHQADGVLATTIWLRSEARRWLPGGMWGYASRAVQAKELNLSLGVASASMFLELVFTMAAAVLVTAPVLLIYRVECATLMSDWSFDVANFYLAVFGIALIATLAICFRNVIRSKWDSVCNKFSLVKHLSIRPYEAIQVLIFYLAMAFLNGLITLFILWAFPLIQYPPAAMVVAATSLAWMVGLLAVFSPGGVVVREGVFAITLLFWLPLPLGMTVAVAARLVQMFAEVVCLIWVSFDWRHARRFFKVNFC